ncbi:transglycosylase family protein [Streptomyces sp. ICBB 8177]|uniref:LysM peptidoglycan-binding domain-containing protein n=1 Tax=Streptomyces sp. ICBB 8177 TaxID=563922 RepID=UPI000D673469|nr:transglycosylase family protein [Streptomyces sp. ICBB 8177]PWI46045.1 hypothetical protein CK485_02630 [Streptomyces sp. ICBB 8177]
MPKHRKPRQAPKFVVTVGATGAGLALPLFASGSAHAASDSTWDSVAQCETGGMWSADNGDGFYGGLQLDQSTWDRFGGTAYASRPDLASRQEQIAVAQTALDRQGPDYWAECGAGAGLTQGGPAPQPVTGDPGDSAPSFGLDTGPSTSTTTTTPTTGSGETGGTTTPTGSPAPSTSATPDPSGSSPSSSSSPSPSSSSSASAPTASASPAPSTSGKHPAPSSSGSSGSSGTPNPSGAASGSASGTPDPSGSSTAAPAPGGTGTPGSSATDGDRGDGDTSRDSGDGRSQLPGDGGRATGQGGASYTVQPGDNLSEIASDHSVPGGWSSLYDANKSVVGGDPDLILPGQQLTLG